MLHSFSCHAQRHGADDECVKYHISLAPPRQGIRACTKSSAALNHADHAQRFQVLRGLQGFREQVPLRDVRWAMLDD